VFRGYIGIWMSWGKRLDPGGCVSGGLFLEDKYVYIYIYGLHPATTWICLVGDFLLSTVVNQQEKAPFGSDYVLGLFPFAPFPSKSK